jgi:hypothetical protein
VSQFLNCSGGREDHHAQGKARAAKRVSGRENQGHGWRALQARAAEQSVRHRRDYGVGLAGHAQYAPRCPEAALDDGNAALMKAIAIFHDYELASAATAALADLGLIARVLDEHDGDNPIAIWIVVDAVADLDQLDHEIRLFNGTITETENDNG